MRLSEVYLSIQGEGPRVGEPTIFVRFGGCNLKCPGWPCDSQFAIDPAFRAEWEIKTPEEVYQMILAISVDQEKVNICLTGGEPFLQNKDELQILVNLLGDTHGIDVIECFSNGTLEYPIWAFEQISFVMDWKLPGSGETNEGKRLQNFANFTEKDAVKFTIRDEADLAFAISIYDMHIQCTSSDMDSEVDIPQDSTNVQVFYGAVWGKIENEELIGKVLEHGLPWRFTMQIHNYVYDRNQRGI